MPSAALRACVGSSTCREPVTYRGRCAVHSRAQDVTRYNADTRKWYSSDAWRTLRLSVLAEQPVCVDCRVKASTIGDHIIPHRGRYALFFDRANVQGMCKDCHGRKTARGA